MDFISDPADATFHEEARIFIRDNLPADIARRGQRDYHCFGPDIRAWQKILNAKGWAAPHWPKEYGGAGWSTMQNYIWQCELRLAGAPVSNLAAIDLAAPVIFTFGSAAQKAHFLPRMLSGEDLWCQGFSEPGSGSDLASLRTKAELDGDDYIVNGQKIWTSDAQWADWVFMLVRTNAEVKPQAGISFLLIDMKSEGVTRRPIWSIDEGLTLNETFFDNVRVPAANLVGEAGAGWTYAKFLLGNERSFSAEAPHSKADLARLKMLAADQIATDPIFAHKVARYEIELTALEWAVLRVLHTPHGDAAADSVAAVLKLRGAELRQRVVELSAEAIGDRAVAVAPDPEGTHNLRSDGLIAALADDECGITHKAMFRRATTIYGGTNEIQRQIIAKGVLGL